MGDNMNIEQAKQLTYKQVLVDQRDKRRWYVNGKVRTWKKDTTRIEIPVKHGLYAYGTITDSDLKHFELE